MGWRILVILTAWMVVPDLAAQQVGCTDRSHSAADCTCRGGPGSEPGCPPKTHVVCPRCYPPEGPARPESGSRPESGNAVQGMFVAPPRSGTIVEESGSVGVRGLALHFPECRIGLPTLELPSLVRFRSGARMKIDSATAPFVAWQGGRGAAALSGMRGVGVESAESYSEETALESGPRPESIEAELTKKCEELTRMKDELLKAEHDLKSRLDQIRQSLQQFENCPPRSCPTPPPESLPPPVQSTGYQDLRRLPLQEPQVIAPEHVTAAAFSEAGPRTSPRRPTVSACCLEPTSSPAPARMWRLPPVTHR